MRADLPEAQLGDVLHFFV